MLVIGDHIIETPNVIRSRAQEAFSYRTLLIEYLKSGAKWYSAPGGQCYWTPYLMSIWTSPLHATMSQPSMQPMSCDWVGI